MTDWPASCRPSVWRLAGTRRTGGGGLPFANWGGILPLAMRLGLLGPAHGDLAVLTSAAGFLLREVAIDRAIYLGLDGALDDVVVAWAASLVGGDPREEAIWKRAQRCLQAAPSEIDEHLARERERRGLRVFEALPGPDARVIELLNGQVAVLIHDADDLDEEDMLPAAFLVFGASEDPLVKVVGTRWFLSPGSLDTCGVMVLEDLEDGVHLRLFDNTCRLVRTERLLSDRKARLSIR